MATDSLSALFDVAQAAGKDTRSLACAECGDVCTRTSGRQKWCPACSILIRKRKQAERNAAKPLKNGKIGDEFSCDRCGLSTIRKHGCELRCDACKDAAKREQKSESRKKSAGTCTVCQQKPARSVRSLYCVDCYRAHIKSTQRAWRKANAGKLARDKEEYYRDNSEKAKARASKWRKDNPDRRRAYSAELRKDGKYRLRYAISNGIRISLKGNKGGRSWERLVGYTVNELRGHLEKQFKRGMKWDNFGSKWHVDHIVPDSSFSYESSDDAAFRHSWALTNLRPLWAEENMSKGAKRIFLI